MISESSLLEANILVVDDNPVNIKLIEQSLAKSGYQNCVSTMDPLSVGEIIQSNQIDLILLDINMPLLDGFGVLGLIKSHYGANICPPVIMVTAQIDTENRLKALELGASDYITKPFNREELLKRTRVHLENWFMKKMLLEQNQQLERRVRKRTAELEKAHLDIVFRLGRASEYRDNETGNHVKRVSLYAEALARKAGLSEEECYLIKLASPMHDVGKIGISDLIMLKPGKLDKEEYIEMQRHVAIGGEILSGSDVPILQYAYDITMTHHEKFNGKGYPSGLAGKAIPISGRIVALVDVFDALTSSRPYKEAWSLEKAVDLIQSEKGEHFDPFLVECFIEILPEIKRITLEFDDE